MPLCCKMCRTHLPCFGHDSSVQGSAHHGVCIIMRHASLPEHMSGACTGGAPARSPGSLAAAAAAARRCGMRARRPRLSWLVGAACRAPASPSGGPQRAAWQGRWSGLRRASAVLRCWAAASGPRGGRGTGPVRWHAQRPLRRRPPEARRHRRYSRRGRGRCCSAVSRREGCGHGAAAGQRREAWPGAGQVGGRLDAPQGRRSAAQTRHAAPAGAGLISTARPIDPASAHRVRPYPNPLAPRNKLQRRAHFSRSSAEKAQSASWASRRASSASDSAAGPGAPFMSRWPPPPAMRTCASRHARCHSPFTS